MKGNSNINRGLRFSDISNRDKSNKDNPGFRNLKVNNKDNLRLNNDSSNNLNHRFRDLRDNLSNHNNKANQRFSNPRDSSNPNNSILPLGASNARGNHNTHSLKENLKEGMQNIESRMTRSLKTLPSFKMGTHTIFCYLENSWGSGSALSDSGT